MPPDGVKRTLTFNRRQVSTIVKDGGDAWSGILAVEVDPVFATQHYGPDGVLSGVIAQL
jgi:hypothetical protein